MRHAGDRSVSKASWTDDILDIFPRLATTIRING